MSMDGEGCPRVLMLEVMEDLEGKVVVVGRVSGWRGVGGDEGREGGRGGRYDDGHDNRYERV